MILFSKLLQLLQIRKNHNQTDVYSIHKQIIKEFLDERMHTLINDGKVINKINCNVNSFYVNEKDIDTESLNFQNTSPITPDKSFYTATIFIPILSTEKPLISPKESLIKIKSTNPSLDHHKTLTNFANIYVQEKV